MAVFSARRFKVSRGGSDSTNSMMRSMIAIARNNAGGILPLDMLDDLITQAQSQVLQASTPTERAAAQQIVSELQLEKRDREIGFDAAAPMNREKSLMDLKLKELETKAGYLYGNDPKKYLTELIGAYDQFRAGYDQAVARYDGTGIDTYPLLVSRHELDQKRNEYAGLLETLSSGTGRKDSMGLVLTPDANGGIADIKLLPAAKIRGAGLTDATTPDGIPIYVIANQVEPDGTRRAVIGNSVFEEQKSNTLSRLLGLSQKQQSGTLTPQELQESLADSSGVKFKLKNGDPAAFDISKLSLAPVINQGEYGVGKNGFYKRTADGYQFFAGSLDRANLQPHQYKFLDADTEASIANSVTGSVSLSPRGPATFDVPVVPAGSSQAAPEDTEEAPTLPESSPRPTPTIKEPSGFSRFAGKAKEIFSGIGNALTGGQ